MPDSQIQKEMNQVFMAMDESLAESTNRLTGEGLQNEWLKKQARGFFRLNLLTPWTKSVQLASFNIGKNLIRENLEKLNKLSKEGVDIFNETATKELSRKEIRNVQLLKSEVFDLGIDIDDGLRWLNSGAKTGFGAERKDGVITGQIKYEDDFYKSVLQGAGRFVNEVIMPVGRDRARIPIFMTNPKVDILTQFLRYPTVFSNTVLKNYIRSAVTNPTVNGAKLGAFGLMATSIALGTNYWRSNDDNRDRIVEDGFEDEDFIKAFQRVGLFGPLEYGLRFKNSIQYTKNPLVSAVSLGGPTVTDTLGLLLGRKGLVETVAGKTPFIGTKGIMDKYIGANPYDDLNIFAKEIDKEAAYALGIKDRPKDRKYTRNYTDFYRSNYSVGGLVEGEDTVPYTKEDPADRINPYTGEPYQEREQLGMGGKLYDFYRFGGEKLGVTNQDIEKAYEDAINYTTDWYKNTYNEPFLTTEWTTQQGKEADNVSEIFAHGLSGYRFGDSKLKRAAIQAKDLSQAVTHLSKDEFGDYLNNKVGFKLRDKYPNDEKAAMKELEQLINVRDKQLYFKNKIEKTGEPYQEQMNRLGFDNGGEASGPPKFEKRIARPDPEMFIKDPQSGNPQTHRMGWGDIEGQFIAYPTIIEQDGKLVQYGNNTKTMKLMKKSGNFKAFDTKEKAKAYAEGNWKTDEFNKTYRKEFALGGLGKLVGKEIVENISKPRSLSRVEMETLPLKYSQKEILKDESFKGLQAHHGTAHSFDEFTTDFLKSGEGVMAYGKGLYFAESKDIAKTYRANVSKLKGLEKLNMEYQDFLNKAEIASKAGDKIKQQQMLLKAIDKDTEINTFKSTKISAKEGALYDVNIKTTKKHLLDWDKKMDSQSAGVVNAAEIALDILTTEQLERFVNRFSRYESFTRDAMAMERPQLLSDAKVALQDMTGDEFINAYNKLVNNISIQKVASRSEAGKTLNPNRIFVEDKLRDEGVQGIRYTDGFSRKKKGKKTKNYVIFDARIIEIAKKYGISIPAAGTMLLKMDSEGKKQENT